jgi:ATP-dependent helicase HrpA
MRDEPRPFPKFHYPPDLPVSGARGRIVEAVRRHRVVVVVGETGSGKTTQLPKMAAEALGEAARGMVGCTQPRRLAAVSVAARVAKECRCEVGGAVGYQVRFDDRTGRGTRLKFMTDGILLAETQADRMLRRYSALILDEAHERSLNIDFLLGYLRRLLERRKDLRVVISSATMDAGAFAEFFQFGEERAPVIEVSGRTFPVDEEFLPPWEDEALPRHVARALDGIVAGGDRGDVLVFLPGEREIRDCAEVLEGREFPDTEILPLFARLGLQDQQRIFSPSGGRRRVVLATNVAETSLTIPGIVYVVDSGLARVSRWSPARGVQRLHVEPVSRASTRQRMGRCGRVRPGVCVRLFDDEDMAERREFTDPEIRRSSLAGVILRMKSLGLPEIDKFPLLDPPSPKLVAEGYRTLREIGALDRDKRLTDIGQTLSRMPLAPRLGRMLLEAEHEGCLPEVLVIVAGLEINDPRERPSEKTKEADTAHSRWRDKESDFLAILGMWMDLGEFRERRRWKLNRLRKFCRAKFLNWRRVVEWGNLRDELETLVRRECRWKADRLAENLEKAAAPEKIHRALLAGVPRQFGLWDREEREYRSAAGYRFAIFPGSGLFGEKRPEWAMAFELVDTTRLWARRMAKIDPAWVEQVAPHLCRRRVGEGHWDEQQGAVYAKETILCGGLPVVRDRRVHLGRFDPEAARRIFLLDGLLGGGLKARCRFLEQLEEMKEVVEAAEHKLRRNGGLWDERRVYEFFDSRIPKDIHTAKAFHRWRSRHEDELMISVDDVVSEDLESLGLEEFPDALEHGGEEFTLYYQTAPGERDDGLTVGAHIDQLARLPDWLPGWGVPGMLAERVERLVRGLPKDLRRSCQPVAAAVGAFVDEWRGRAPDGPLGVRLAQFLENRIGRRVDPALLDPQNLEGPWLVKIWVCDDEGKELAMGADLPELRRKLAKNLGARARAAVAEDWARPPAREWPGGALPERVETPAGFGFPALVDEGDAVSVRAFADPAAAAESHRAGCVRLLLLAHPDHAHWIAKQFKVPKNTTPPQSGKSLSDLDWKHLAVPKGKQTQQPACLGIDRATVGADELVAVSAEGALGAPLPRSPDDFAERSRAARERWFDAARTVSAALDESFAHLPGIREWILAQRADRHLAPVAEDLEEQLEWLLRPRFLWRAGFPRFRGHARHFKAIRSRLGRIETMPILRDLEKMERLRRWWSPWMVRWTAAPDDPRLWSFGWMLEEWRIALFAPDVSPTQGVSEKKLEKAWEALAL